MMKGYKANPAVSRTPVTAVEERTKAQAGHRRADAMSASAVAPNAARGARIVHGCFEELWSQPGGSRSTVFAAGANAESAGGIATIWKPSIPVAIQNPAAAN